MSESLELGDTAKDSITGLEGVVVCKTQYLYGCVRFGIQPRELKDGKPIDPSFFDEEQCVLVSKAETPGGRKTGGPTPAPPRQSDPRR